MGKKVIGCLALAAIAVSCQQVVTPTATLTYPTSLPTETLFPTEFPSSYFDLDLSLTSTATEVQVGDNVTITLVITNVGKLSADRTYCHLLGKLEDGTPIAALPEPVIEIAPKVIDFVPPGAGFRPGDVKVCEFALGAMYPGMVQLEGIFGGKAYFGALLGSERSVGEYSHPLTIHILPSP